MAFTYTWSVTNLKIKDEVNSEGATLSNAVCQTYWKVTGTDENGNEGTFSGATPFTAANVPEENFVAFEDLTEEQVLGWIQSVVENDPTYKEHIDGRIQYEIDATTVQEVTTMPWAAEEVTPEPDAVASVGDDE